MQHWSCSGRLSMVRIPTTRSGTSPREPDSRPSPRAFAIWASRMTTSIMLPSGLSMTRSMPIARKWCARASPMATLSHEALCETMVPEPVTPTQEAGRRRAETSERQRDAWLILVMRGLRSLAYGVLAVLLGVSLAGEGFSPAAIGLLITVSLVGDVVGTYLIGLFADTWGRRSTLVFLALLMAGTGAIFGLVRSYPVLLVAAFFGTLGTSASETAPFLPIDQAMLAQITTPEQRTALFARYNLVASLSVALGALVAGLPDLLVHLHLSQASGIRLLFGVYAVLALVVARLSLCLSQDVEVPRRVSVQVQNLKPRLAPPLGRSRGVASHRALQCGRARRRTGGAELDGTLLSPSLWRATHESLSPVLFREPPLGALVPGGGTTLSPLRPAQHDGLHAFAFKRTAHPGGLRTHISHRGNIAAATPRSE